MFGRRLLQPMKRYLATFALCLVFSTTLMSQTNDERRLKIEEHERNEPSKEAVERRARSVTRLRQEGVPTIDHLPVIEDSTQAKTRTAEEIARRAIAVCLTAAKGEGVDQATVDALVQRYGAEAFLSPKEAAFIKDPNPTQQERVDYSWRYEDYWVLLWALGYVDTLERPEAMCDVPKAVRLLKDRTTARFVQDAKLRPLASILDEADLAYRYHWAAVDARVKGKETPAKLEGGVVQERHYVLNWLIGYMDQDWDDISTDT